MWSIIHVFWYSMRPCSDSNVQSTLTVLLRNQYHGSRQLCHVKHQIPYYFQSLVGSKHRHTLDTSKTIHTFVETWIINNSKYVYSPKIEQTIHEHNSWYTFIFQYRLKFGIKTILKQCPQSTLYLLYLLSCIIYI